MKHLFMQFFLTFSNDTINMRDPVSHPFKTRTKTWVLCIWIFTFIDSRWESKSFWTQSADHSANLLLISSWIQFWFVTVATCVWYLLAIFVLRFCLALWWRNMPRDTETPSSGGQSNFLASKCSKISHLWIFTGFAERRSCCQVSMLHMDTVRAVLASQTTNQCCCDFNEESL